MALPPLTGHSDKKYSLRFPSSGHLLVWGSFHNLTHLLQYRLIIIIIVVIIRFTLAARVARLPKSKKKYFGLLREEDYFFENIHWVSELVSKWASESVSQWVSESVSQWVSASVSQWVSESVSQWVSESVSKSVSESVIQSVSEWVSESVSEWVS